MAIQYPFAVIPHPLGTVTTGNARTNRPATHLGEFKHIGMTWQSNGNSNLWIRGNWGQNRPVDFVSLLSANAQAGTTIRVRLGASQAAVDGTAAYDSGTVAFINPSISREDGLYHSHLELPSVQSRQWWRIDIGGHSGDFEAAMLVMGQKAQSSSFYNSDFGFGPDDKGELEFTRWGVAEEEGGRIFRRLDMTFGWLSQADFETKFRPLVEKLGSRGMALWCFDPEATVYRQSKTYFGRLVEKAYAQGGVKPGRFSLPISIESMI